MTPRAFEPKFIKMCVLTAALVNQRVLVAVERSASGGRWQTVHPGSAE
jgi:hypothetical protein